MKWLGVKENKMKSPLEQVKQLDNLIHRLSKMESQMQTGRWLDAHRECCSLREAFKRARQDLMSFNLKDKEDEK